MGARVTVVDYGRGNLRSVCKALERSGAKVELSADPERAARAERLVLPGVGAFDDAMGRLRSSGLDAAVKAHVAAGRPYLGICLGLQLLFERGDEGSGSEGLGLLPGRVVALDAPRLAALGLKVPHMGWAKLEPLREDPALSAMPNRWVYFVHSFHAACAEPSDVLATADHGGPVTAAVRRGNILATQFHPEKSQAAGLALLGAWLAKG